MGLTFSAVVISELELHGYAIKRVYGHGRLIGVRLLEDGAPDAPAHAGATDRADLRDSQRDQMACSGA